MRKLILLFSVLLLLAGCSAATRYNVNVNVLSFVPAHQRTLSIPSGSGTFFFPGSSFEGQVVSVPTVVDVIERAQLVVRASVTNTGSTNFSGNLELRLAPVGDTNLVDNNGGDLGIGYTSLTIPPGQTQNLTIDLTLNANQNQAAFNIVKSGNFRIGVRVGATSTGGILAFTEARVALTGRPFAFFK
ncbi:MAG: hypothetical protein NZ849_06130 [Meiothermus sp.]|uniref:hypothetical protein n=1 Tax=Meiothermus sp. TaxID=1955249 RepID=UPI0025DC721D|nr:hypothetical protein [Meiothermus sp.]MCS7194476.1 hypothetical protein [Meiothermus sp.]MCX7739405.1 hypothetical protein [Meiothermus sp.]MDW8091570.1 hypothetical protein [Meiothermus sp.]MDW8482320.1 hypothetical protein [Meiothermus sp.]